MENLNDFDYSSPAELYTFARKGGGGPSMNFRRFDSAADAVQFLIEELPAARQKGAILEVREVRYHQAEIRKLYDAEDYPLPRAETDD